jgi:inhibitor of KinA
VDYKIFTIGENALTIDFGNTVSADLNDKVLQLTEFIKQNNFKGFIELVPAYSSLTIFYDLIAVRKHFKQFPTTFAAVQNFVANALKDLPEIEKRESSLIRVPVCYDKRFAPDLEFVAENAGLSKEEVIKIHTSKIYRVFMIGFLPAFAYMGEIDERIAITRKQAPRTDIEKGSVGIAGKQTGIYPLDSPGGWQIIGQTPFEMFKPENEQISFLKTGDSVQFYPISPDEFSKIKEPKSKT